MRFHIELGTTLVTDFPGFQDGIESIKIDQTTWMGTHGLWFHHQPDPEGCPSDQPTDEEDRRECACEITEMNAHQNKRGS